ncbi:MAG: hypothetical protein AAGM22_14325 [Acidobacteriota bacterium]
MGCPPSAGSTDVMTEHFTKGVEALYGDDLEVAVKHFETIAGQAEGRQLRDRASQYLEICRNKLAGDDPVEDFYLAAVMAKNRGDLEAALDFAGKGDDDEKFAYLTASLHSLSGDEEAALESLSRAIDLEPRNRVHAYHDPDFRTLREAEAFSTLLRAQSA